MLTESVTLSLAGGALGVALAALLLGSVATLAPVSIPRLDRASIDPGVLGFALLLSVVTGVLFGLVPALRVSRESLQATLALDSAHERRRARRIGRAGCSSSAISRWRSCCWPARARWSRASSG